MVKAFLFHSCCHTVSLLKHREHSHPGRVPAAHWASGQYCVWWPLQKILVTYKHCRHSSFICQQFLHRKKESLLSITVNCDSSMQAWTPHKTGLTGKECACNVGDLGLIPGLGRSPGEGKGYPLQYSGLQNSMDCIVHGVTESDTTECLSLSRDYLSLQLKPFLQDPCLIPRVVEFRRIFSLGHVIAQTYPSSLPFSLTNL